MCPVEIEDIVYIYNYIISSILNFPYQIDVYVVMIYNFNQYTTGFYRV